MKNTGAGLLVAACLSLLFVGCEAAINTLSVEKVTVSLETSSPEGNQELKTTQALDPLPTTTDTESTSGISHESAPLLATTEVSHNVVYIQPSSSQTRCAGALTYSLCR